MKEIQINKFKEDLRDLDYEKLVNNYSEEFVHAYLDYMMETDPNKLQYIFDDYIENGYSLDELIILDSGSIIRQFKNYYY